MLGLALRRNAPTSDGQGPMQNTGFQSSPYLSCYVDIISDWNVNGYLGTIIIAYGDVPSVLLNDGLGHTQSHACANPTAGAAGLVLSKRVDFPKTRSIVLYHDLPFRGCVA